MSYPYLTDLANAMFGTEWHVAVPTFGMMVALAVIVASRVAQIEARRFTAIGLLPARADTVVLDVALIAVVFGMLGARVFHILDNFSVRIRCGRRLTRATSSAPSYRSPASILRRSTRPPPRSSSSRSSG